MKIFILISIFILFFLAGTGATYYCNFLFRYNLFDRTEILTSQDIIAKGNCIDKARYIVNILERHYTGFDRVKVAVGKEHVQTVLEDIGGKVRFLSLQGMSVVTSPSEFDKEHLFLMSTEDYKKAVEYYRPGVTISELRKFKEIK